MDRGTARADAGIDVVAMVAVTASLDELLVGIVELAVRAVAPAVSASVALTAPAWSGQAVAADGRAARLETAQRRDAVGPGPDALRALHAVESRDLRAEQRWPAFTRAATADGMLAVRSVPMLVRGTAPIGVLTVYGTAAGAFRRPDRRDTDLIAGLATVAVTGTTRSYDDTELSARLRHALTSRSAIDQAIGIVMAERACTAERALTELRTMARERRTTLPQVAADVVARAGAPRPGSPQRASQPPSTASTCPWT